MPRKFIDLTGKRYGRLLVLKLKERQGHENSWTCLCDCGRKKNILSNSLTSGRTKSCRCLQKEQLTIDLKDKIFGKLKVLNLVKNEKRGTAKCLLWLCKCECGKNKKIPSHCLLNGASKSCGCSKIEFTVAKTRKLETSFNKLYGSYLAGARSRNFEFKINKEQFRDITSKNCFYCNRVPSQKSEAKSKYSFYIYNGIDRQNSLKGYTLKNCVPCCRFCNRAKMEATKDDFLDMVKRIAIHHNLVTL